MHQCITNKKRYPTRELAEEALLQAWAHRYFKPASGPVGVYLCEDCGDFHLTSKGEMNTRLADALRTGHIDRMREASEWEQRLRRKNR